MTSSRRTLSGFTMVELSVVIVIAGLILAVILGSSSLIKSARLKNVIEDMHAIETAVKLYESKYQELPGDNQRAYEIFDATASGTVCGATALLCNGDGDGKIGDEWNTAAIGAQHTESLRAWQHLQAARLYTTDLSGVPDTTNFASIRVNIPPSNLETVGYAFGTDSRYWEEEFRGEAKNHLIVGSPHNDLLRGSALTPTDAYSIDIKLDDGKAENGLIIAERGSEFSGDATKNGECIQIYGTEHDYNLDNPARACILMYFFEKPRLRDHTHTH
jgi:prepilin-type N-terminal cleavage/methylation domain-containing protein